MADSRRANEVSLGLAALRRKKQEDEMSAKHGNEISEALRGVEASPLEVRVDELYRQFQKTKKPKKAPAKAAPAQPAESDAMKAAKAAGFKGKFARMRQEPSGQQDLDMSPGDYEHMLAMQQWSGQPSNLRGPQPVRKPESISGVMRVLPSAVSRATPVANPPPPTPPPAPAEKKMSAAERVGDMPAHKAEAILQDTYASHGRHGKYSPEDAELIAALQARAKGFDYSKAKATPVVSLPSFLGVKK